MNKQQRLSHWTPLGMFLLTIAAFANVVSADQDTDASPSKVSAAQDRMPAFSWDTLPLYIHVRKTAAFTPRELDYLASFPLITFEKTTGSKAYGATDLGTINAALAVKQINPRTKVLFYRNVIVHYGGYSFDEQLKATQGAFLHNKAGDDKLVRGRVKAYDLSSEPLRKWWVSSMAAVGNQDPIDGVLLDGNVKVLTTYLQNELPEGKKAAVIEGFHEMMRESRKTLHADKLMIANILRARFDNGGLEFMEYFDGSYLEGFEHAVGGISKAEYIAKGIETVQTAAGQGKIIALTLNVANSSLGDGVDEQSSGLDDFANVSQERLDYCIALFLVIAERHSYLCIHDGYDVNSKGKQGSASKLWLKKFPEYSKPLGPPTGPARRQGYRYFRQFEHAVVVLDIEAGRGVVTWK